MTEQQMLTKKEFISFILEGQKQPVTPEKRSSQNQTPVDDLMAFGFDTPVETEAQVETDTSFAQRLLEAAAFGKPDYVQTTSLIRSSDTVARHLPPRAAFWAKTQSRPYQTLLFEAVLNHKELLAIPAFKSRKMRHLDMVEDALARMVSEALDGFQRGGEGVTADVRKGKREETLCIVSIRDERDQEPVRLVCFGTVNAKTGGLETFHLTEQTRLWDRQLAQDHLGLLYERQFKKLGSTNWQEAFTTSEERKQAENLLNICSKKTPLKTEIEEHVITLLDTIAKGFGLKCKPGQTRRLQAFALPADHDIGIDPEEMSEKHGGKNPFGGVTLRDEKSRLLGYIVYPLKKKEDAAQLRGYLEKHNRFHNVLVVFPDGDETTLELWQGQELLSGKLRKGHGFKDAAEAVSLLSRFFVVSKAKVRNPAELAQELAYRARYLRKLALRELEEEPKEGPLRNLYKNFKETLIYDQTEREFADAFAQTLTYSLLTSRWIGNERLTASGDRFTRQTAIKYLPTTSNFLGELFKTALAVKLDDQRGRLLWLVDDIADLLDRIDVTYVFGIGDKNSDQATDPVIHFYEPFLAAYDSELRNKRGVFYTPQPVVSHIVRNVHVLLQTEFGLADGLADITTWGEMLKKHPTLELPPLTKASGEKGTISLDEPFVQILDIATGTATFLVEVIDVIYRTLVANWRKQGLTRAQQQTAWNDYVPQNLLTRLYGYELMMAPYAVAHMKIGLKLIETGYHFGAEERARVYLTNALEPWKQQLSFSGITTLSQEATAVNQVKRNKRFTVVIGNPPYAGISYNNSEYAKRLVDAYKIIDGERLNEKKLWLQDDYVKFLRTAQMTVECASCGILGFITNHGYLDNPTFRGMRQSLLNSFEWRQLVDLHGNSKKKEIAPDGTPDVNVFDIQQGVAIGIFVRRIQGNSGNALTVRGDLFGSREGKYRALASSSVQPLQTVSLLPTSPLYLFVQQDQTNRQEFESMVLFSEVTQLHSVGVVTARDHLTITYGPEEIWNRVQRFSQLGEEEAREEFELRNDVRDWKVSLAQADLRSMPLSKKRVKPILYRPFDTRFIYYTGKNKGFIGQPAAAIMSHMNGMTNIGLMTTRKVEVGSFGHVFCSRIMTESHSVSLKEVNYLFPLWLYLDGKDLVKKEKRVNFTPQFLRTFAETIGVQPLSTKGLPPGLTYEDIFCYAYGVFHSPCYRSRYAEFLKTDFPRLPLIRNLNLFRALSSLGGELVAIHLLESSKLDRLITCYNGPKNPEIGRVGWSGDTVWIDAAVTKKDQPAISGTIGFRGVSETVWNFHIGGYQVCHKWLKDRKGRTLSDDDIAHYQKIIVALSETIRLMAEIDKVIDAHGGWPGAFVSEKGGAK